MFKKSFCPLLHRAHKASYRKPGPALGIARLNPPESLSGYFIAGETKEENGIEFPITGTVPPVRKGFLSGLLVPYGVGDAEDGNTGFIQQTGHI
jgi:hypothetical protein